MSERLLNLPVRVYYEDTDAGGVVYHARYLHFFERARTEYLRTLNFSQQILLAKQVAFVVKSMSIDYIQPAKLDDYLMVSTRVEAIKGATLFFEQTISRDSIILSRATVKVACVDLGKMKPIAIPKNIKDALKND